MEDYITIHSKQQEPEALEVLLTSELAQDADIRLEIRRSRALETAVLIAIVGSVGAAVGALISGLLKITAQKGESKIVIQGRSGRKVEVPANTPDDKLAEYVKLAEQLDIERIEI